MKFEYNTDDYIRKINSGTSYFNTFLDKETLAAGVLVLKPGEEDAFAFNNKKGRRKASEFKKEENEK